MPNRQFSLSSILAAIAFASFGLALMRVTRALSLFNLIGLFLIGSCPGIIGGYARNKLTGSIVGGVLSGALLIATLILVLLIAQR